MKCTQVPIPDRFGLVIRPIWACYQDYPIPDKLSDSGQVPIPDRFGLVIRPIGLVLRPIWACYQDCLIPDKLSDSGQVPIPDRFGLVIRPTSGPYQADLGLLSGLSDYGQIVRFRTSANTRPIWACYQADLGFSPQCSIYKCHHDY